ncbi:MAG: hypothetical protein GF368_01020 [Candidatus Aenigmarchaeota archaeon]|nr:hypothetical protein [Candidatus Aenigmarchaeota archaeon]
MNVPDKLETLYMEMRIRNYSSKTIKSYIKNNQKFLEFIQKPSTKVNSSDIKKYIKHLIDEGKSPSNIRQVIASLRFYHSEVLHRKFFKNIKNPKISRKLPIVLSKKRSKKNDRSYRQFKTQTNNPNYLWVWFKAFRGS